MHEIQRLYTNSCDVHTIDKDIEDGSFANILKT